VISVRPRYSLSRSRSKRRLPFVSAASALLGGRKLADPDYFEKAAGAEASGSAPRLLFAGRSRSIWFVHYTRGGRAAGYDLLVLSTSPEGQVVAQAHLASATRAWSMPNLKNMLRQGRFKSAAAGPARRD